MSQRTVLVTGATGYVGSRLIPALAGSGHNVRAMSRRRESVEARYPGIEAVAADVLDAPSLVHALDGVDVAYYLIHSMSGNDFESVDRQAARNFADAASSAGVGRLVYLGGLGRADDRLSSHLQSRQEVGRILAAGGQDVVELRAAIIIGSGSVAFDMLRHLTERLPIMVAPRWLATKIQPLAEKDLVRYLVEASAVDASGHTIVEVGGDDILTYRDMILRYARRRGLRRLIIGVPVLTPSLSSHWIRLVTPIPYDIARPLIDGLKNEVIVTVPGSGDLFPDIEPRGYDAAVAEVLDDQLAFLDAASSTGATPPPGALEGIIIDRQWVTSKADPEVVGRVVASIGGDPRWYPLRWAWWVRARLDDAFGGAGLHWERSEGPLRKGQRVDWWTVEDTGPRRLLLKALMKAPGEAWLEWVVVPREDGSQLRQTAYYRPRGVLGRTYWYGLYIFHEPIFRLMAVRLARRAELDSGELRGLGRWSWWRARRNPAPTD